MLWKSFVIVACLSVFAGGARASADDNVLVVDEGVFFGALDTIVKNDVSLATLPFSILELPPAAANGPPPAAGLSGIGLGLQLGFPTALTLKLGAPQRDGLVFGLGAGFGYGGFAWFSITGEYQLHLVTLVSNPTLSLTGYFSPGLWLALSSYNNGRYFGFYNGNAYAVGIPIGLGVRGTFGLSMLFQAAPVELYLELTPAIFVFPGFDPGLGWSLGFRYYF